MPTTSTPLSPGQTNPPRVPLLPVKKLFGLELGLTSQLLRAENLRNRGLRIENRGDVPVYLSMTGSPASENNICIRPGDDFDWAVGIVPALYVIAPGAKKDHVIILFEFE